MNNYCKYCGEKLENNPSICPKCNTKLFENEINTEEEKNKLKEYKKKENKYLIIIITLYALPYLSNYLKFSEEYNFISYIKPLLYLGAIITLIYARITMNKSIKIKVR